MTQSEHQQNFVSDFQSRLAGRTAGEVATFFDWTMRFVWDYCAGYVLGGSIHLLLDNSLVQDFKHRKNNPERALRALSFTAFCRFARGWSDRSTYLAISPVCIYEHIGRRTLTSVHECRACLSELRRSLTDTRLEVQFLGYSGISGLLPVLRAVDADARLLADLADEIEKTDWRLDFEPGRGKPMALDVARSFISDDLPLRYFDPWYVKFTFATRIEKQILQQSQHNPPDARPVGTGGLSIDLAKLNEIKNGVLKGLGDIDLLQLCDVQRQFKAKQGYTLLGQTFDKQLANVLHERFKLVISGRSGDESSNLGEDIFGRPDMTIAQMFDSNPFAEQDKKEAQIRPSMLDFVDTLRRVCRMVVDSGPS